MGPLESRHTPALAQGAALLCLLLGFAGALLSLHSARAVQVAAQCRNWARAGFGHGGSRAAQLGMAPGEFAQLGLGQGAGPTPGLQEPAWGSKQELALTQPFPRPSGVACVALPFQCLAHRLGSLTPQGWGSCWLHLPLVAGLAAACRAARAGCKGNPDAAPGQQAAPSPAPCSWFGAGPGWEKQGKGARATWCLSSGPFPALEGADWGQDSCRRLHPTQD